jgi:hypothetical protein
MKSFCNNCPHLKVPDSIKEKFNEFCKPTFIECPTEDKTVAGCLISMMSINWPEFFSFLLKNKKMEMKEYEELKKNGFDI